MELRVPLVRPIIAAATTYLSHCLIYDHFEAYSKCAICPVSSVLNLSCSACFSASRLIQDSTCIALFVVFRGAKTLPVKDGLTILLPGGFFVAVTRWDAVGTRHAAWEDRP